VPFRSSAKSSPSKRYYIMSYPPIPIYYIYKRTQQNITLITEVVRINYLLQSDIYIYIRVIHECYTIHEVPPRGASQRKVYQFHVFKVVRNLNCILLFYYNSNNILLYYIMLLRRLTKRS